MSQKIYMATVGIDSHVYIASATDGQDWSISPTPIPISPIVGAFVTKMPISMCAFGKKYYLGAVATDGHVYLSSSTDGQDWGMWQPLFANYNSAGTFSTSRPVAMTAFRKKLYMLLYGTDGKIHLASMDRSGVWTISQSPLFPKLTSSNTWATVTVFRDTLYMAAVGSDSHIYLGSSHDGQIWTIKQTPLFPKFNQQGAFQTKHTVSLAALGEILCLAAVGTDGQVYMGYSEDAKKWGISKPALFQLFGKSSAFSTSSAVSMSAFEGTLYLAAISTNVYLGSSSDLRSWSMSTTPLFQNFNSAGAFQSGMAPCLASRRITPAPLEADPELVVQTRLMENFIEASPVRNLSKIKSACGSDGVFYVVAADNGGDVYRIVSSSSDEIPWTAGKITCWEPIIDFDVRGGATPEVYMLTAGHVYSAAAGNDIKIDQNTTPLGTAPEGAKFLNIRVGQTAPNYQPVGGPLNAYAVSAVNAGQYSIAGSRGGLPLATTLQTKSAIVDFACAGDDVYNWFTVEFGPDEQTTEYRQENVSGAATDAVASYPACSAVCIAYAHSGGQCIFGVNTVNGSSSLNLLNGSDSLGASSSAIAAASMASYSLVFSVGTDGILSVASGGWADTPLWTKAGKLGGDFSTSPWQLSACATPGVNGEAHVFALGAQHGELYHIWLDREIADWRMVPVVVGNEPELIKFASYATQIELVSDTGGAPMPLANQQLTISASDYLSASINGHSYVLGPNTSVPVFTDLRGMVTVTTQTRALSTPSLKVSALSMPPMTIQPEAYLQDALGYPKSAADLANTLKSARTRVTNQPVVAAGADVADAASGIYQCLSFLKPPASNADAMNQFLSPRSQRAGVHFLAEDEWPDQIALDEIPEQYWSLHFDKGQAKFETLDAESASASDCNKGTKASPKWSWGTLWNSIRQEISSVTCMLVSKTEAGLKIVINVVSAGVKWVFNYVIETVQQVWDVIEGIFAAIGTAFKTLFEWLGSIFNWDDILLTHQALKIMSVKFLAYLTDWFKELESEVDTVFASLEQMLTSHWNELLGSYGSQSTQAMQVDATGDTDTPAAGPHANWLSSTFVNHAKSGSIGPVTPPPADWSAGGDALAQGLDDAFQTGNLSDRMRALSTQLFEKDVSKLTLNDLAAVIGDEVIHDGLTTLNGFIDSNIEHLANGLTDFSTVIQQPWQIPVVSSLYYSITKEQLTLLDVCCLMAAIPATAEYKVILGVKSAVTGDPARPSGPFTKKDIEALSKLTPQQLFGRTAQDQTTQLRSASADETPSNWTSGQQGDFVLIDGYVIGLQSVCLALADLASQPECLVIQQGLSLISAALTIPWSATIPNADVRKWKWILWTFKVISVIPNLGVMGVLAPDPKKPEKIDAAIVYPLLALLEGLTILGFNIVIAYKEGKKFGTPANIQAYLGTLIPISAPVRSFFLVPEIQNLESPVSATAALVGYELIFFFGSVVPIAINTAEGARMVAGIKPVV